MLGGVRHSMKKKRMAQTGHSARRIRRGLRPVSLPGGVRQVGGSGGRSALSRLRAELLLARRRINELQAAAEQDFLLDIYNRRGFVRELSRAIAYINRYQATGALIIFDVDRLKPINDTFGHAAGDDVLRTVARTLIEQVRSSDVVGRFGGDEFAVLLWNLNEADARAKAAALEQAIDGLTFVFGNRMVHAGASAGVAILNAQADVARALDEADRAMYARKAQRRLGQNAIGRR
jgi:diguanylate cyclase (GGDEF)-like protein